MNYQRAYAFMLAGAHIRRPGWLPGMYLRLRVSDNTPEFMIGDAITCLGYREPEPYDDYEAVAPPGLTEGLQALITEWEEPIKSYDSFDVGYARGRQNCADELKELLEEM